MKELVAKKYIRAITESFSPEEISTLLTSLKKVALAFDLEKFREIIQTPSVSDEDKVELVLSIFENKDNDRLVNLIKVLGEKNRFEIIPEICRGLERTISATQNRYVAVLMSKDPFADDVLKNIEGAFAKKLNVDLAMAHESSTKEGVRLMVEDLGVEVSFSKEKFAQDLKEHILKAF